MPKRYLVSLIGIFLGLIFGYVVFYYTPITALLQNASILPRKTIIGFLPYWLLNKAKTDYSPYITTLTYFGLRIDSDGSILQMTDPQQEEPGWYALQSGKLKPFFEKAKKEDIKLSLLMSSGDGDSIGLLIADPKKHAATFLSQVLPIMKKYNFSDLNLDIEYSGQASDSAQRNFTTFVKTISTGLKKNNSATLTMEVTPTDLIKKDLISASQIVSSVDYVVVMGYDYHYIGSYVTGPVAPLFGAGVMLEYDVATAIEKAKAIIPDNKLILGIPLYGYEWETIDNIPQAAIISQTGLTESSSSVEKFLSSCASCSGQLDLLAKESYLIYHDNQTGTYHQIFYPDQNATKAKVDFAQNENLGGIALWALGYEGGKILDPLKDYKNSL